MPFEAAMGLNGFIRLRQWTVWCHWSQTKNNMVSLEIVVEQQGIIEIKDKIECSNLSQTRDFMVSLKSDMRQDELIAISLGKAC